MPATLVSEEQRTRLDLAISAFFREWLVNTGNLRQIGDLVSIFGDDGTAAPLGPTPRRLRSGSSTPVLQASLLATKDSSVDMATSPYTALRLPRARRNALASPWSPTPHATRKVQQVST